MSFFSDIADVYRKTKKPKDILWNRFVARPLAAVLLVPLAKSRITPNQITFLSLLTFVGAMVMLALQRGHVGLIAAILVLELSYVLDCTDGQLARLKHQASPVGAHLDFLMDELKAMLLYGCVAVRLWRTTGDDRVLVVGIAALFCLASGISLTSFMRRPEYGAKPPTADGQPAEVGQRRGAIGLVLNAIEWAARVVVHYPQYLWLCALLDRIEIYFWAYAAVNALYFAKSFAAIMLRLGRFQPRAAAAVPAGPGEVP